MDGIIKLLPDIVANQIAAGEVIQRPASVVKELMENSVDSGATVIELWINDAGKKMIMVTDNGSGMSPADSRLCFERHATSKICRTDDLFTIRTLGFRGEALASVAAVSQLELKTRRAEDELGTLVRVEGGKFIHQEPCSQATGTNISVKNLFFNVPARRNFLKGNNLEMKHILEEFARVALANENITFRFYNDGKEQQHLPSGNLKQRIVNLFGGHYNNRFVPVSQESEIINISGFIGKPEFAKKVRGEQYFFVNGRFFRHSYLHHAVLKAYSELIPEMNIPPYFIFFTIDPSQVDVNIHPTKTEVNFIENQAIYAILHTAVRNSLGKHNLTPMIEFEPEAGFTEYFPKDREIKPPGITINPDYNPFNSPSPEQSGFGRKEPGRGTSLQTSMLNQRGWEKLYDDRRFEKAGDGTGQQVSTSHSPPPIDETTEGATGSKLVQMHNSYIVTSIKSGLLVINQNYAHQRILYEKFIRDLAGREQSPQQLLIPVETEVTPAEMLSLNDMEEFLKAIGFIFTTYDDVKVSFSAIPSGMPQEAVKEVVESLIREWQDDLDPGKDKSASQRIARSLSAKLAVKTGTPLSQKEMQVLTDQLFNTEQPNISPSGRQIYVIIPQTEIEERFIKN